MPVKYLTIVRYLTGMSVVHYPALRDGVFIAMYRGGFILSAVAGILLEETELTTPTHYESYSNGG